MSSLWSFIKTKKDTKKQPHYESSMHLLDLPEEILSIIVGFLDTRSKLCIWETCVPFRKALRRRRHLRSLGLAHSRLSRSHCRFLRDNAFYIAELNLSCAKGFSEMEAVSTLSQLKNLSSLDVTYTVVTLSGASDVCAACPKLYHLACDVAINVAENEPALASPLQRSFSKLKSVHFVVSSSMVTLVQLLHVLVQARELRACSFLISSRLLDTYTGICEFFVMAVTKHTKLKSFSCSFTPRSRNIIHGKYFYAKAWECAVVSGRRTYLSPGLYRYRPDSVRYWELKPDQAFGHDWRYDKTIALYAWPSSITELHSTLYANLLHKMDSKMARSTCTIHPERPHEYTSSYYICSCSFREVDSSKKKYELNLRELVPADRKISITLGSNCNTLLWPTWETISKVNLPWLHNITYLSIPGDFTLSSVYEVLFKYCVNLETLQVECFAFKELKILLHTVHHCRVIRNIEIAIEVYTGCLSDVPNDNLFPVLFRALSACPTLQNVYIKGDMENLPFYVTEDALQSLFVGCPNLFSLNIDARSEGFERILIDITNKILKKLNIAIHTDFSLIISSNKTSWYPPTCSFEESVNVFHLNRSLFDLEHLED